MTQTRQGLPMSPEEYAEWEKAFKDIDSSIQALYEGDKEKSKKVEKSSTSKKKS